VVARTPRDHEDLATHTVEAGRRRSRSRLRVGFDDGYTCGCCRRRREDRGEPLGGRSRTLDDGHDLLAPLEDPHDEESERRQAHGDRGVHEAEVGVDEPDDEQDEGDEDKCPADDDHVEGPPTRESTDKPRHPTDARLGLALDGCFDGVSAGSGAPTPRRSAPPARGAGPP